MTDHQPPHLLPRERLVSDFVIRIGMGRVVEDSRGNRVATRNGIMARYRRALFLTTAIVALAFAADAMRPARAQTVSGTGDISTLPVVSPTWNIGSDIAIGDNTHGELNILNGGKVTSTSAAIAYNPGSTGLVTISGSGSSWINDGEFDIGKFGDGTLNVDDGGLMSTDNLWVGQSGPTAGSSAMNITNGGIVNNTGGTVGDSGAVGDVTVSGYGSAWNNSLGLFVGTSGTGTVLIEDGGVMRSAEATLGTGVGGDATVTVSGSDGSGHVSTWINTGIMTLGNQNTSSGTLNIEDGGRVTTGSVNMGQLLGSTGTATVTGNDGDGNRSTLSVSGLLTVGVGGSGTLDIEDGGLVTSALGAIASGTGSDGTVTVTGSDGNGHVSTWINTGLITLGNSNTSIGTLNIGDGGRVTTGSANIAQQFGSTGTATVTGNDGDGNISTWGITNDLNVGQGGSGTLNIEDGGKVTNGDAYLGYDANSDGTVNVTGTDSDGRASSWTSSGSLVVGQSGDGTLHIEDGGVVNSGNTFVGGDSGVTGTVNVTGGDGNGHFSAWNTSYLLVGYGGTGSLLIEDGAAVTSGESYIAYDSGSIGTITVSGSDGSGHVSNWTTGNLYVGEQGDGTLTIQNGGMVTTNGVAYLADGPGGTGTATVTGDDGHGNVSTWNVGNTLLVGYNGDATLTIDHGGIVRANDVWVALNSPVAGTINLNGDAVNGRGVLEAGMVFNTGGTTAFLNLNGGILRATRDQDGYLLGFDALTVGAEGAWFDTNGYKISVDTAFSGNSTFNKLGLGTLTLTGNSSGFTGTTEIQAGTLELQGAVLGGPANVHAGARLSGVGQVGDTDNRGTVAPGSFFSLGTLTVVGNYASVGGALQIRTQLGDDGSWTDFLKVTGSTSGVTPVTVTNFGGLGAQTHNGIQIVEVDGASSGQFRLANGAFTIAGQPAVVGGAFGYVLRQNPADGGWYLHSSLLATGVGGGAGPGSGASPGSGAPLYQPGVPVYEAYARTLLSLNELTSLRQRVGDREWAPSAGPKGEGAWMRMEGQRDHLEPEVSTIGSKQDINRWKTQFGGDRILERSPDGTRLVAGVNLEFGTATTDVTSFYGDGNIDTQSYGVGGTLTWYDSNGVYVDAQARANWFFSDLTSDVTGRQADGMSGYGYGASLEAGRSLQLGSGFALTPQAQVSYVGTDFYAFDDKFGARVASNRDESLQGRLGVSLDHVMSWENSRGRANKATIYGLVDLKQEMLDGARVLVSDTAFDNRLEQTWGGVGVGGDYSWNNGQYALYGEIRTDTGLDEVGQSYTVKGTAGFRMAL